jgi:uncharacterized membrane protein
MLKKIFFGQTNDPLVWAVTAFIRMKHIRITPGEVESTLLKHPYFPSMAAVTDLLSCYRVETLAMRTTVDNLHKMDFPALAHSTDGTFVVLRNVEKNHVTYLDMNKGWRTESLDNFNARWTGAVLMADASDGSGDPDYKIKNRQETLALLKVPVLLLLAAVLTVSAAALSQSLVLSLVLLLMLTGVVLTVILASSAFQNGKDDNAFCKTNASVDCNAVLSSPAARLMGIPVTSLGFIFFTGMYLSLLLGIFSGHLPLQVMTLLALLVLPYPVFSVLYQYVVVKKWCTLCLAAQCIIILAAVLLLTYYNAKDTGASQQSLLMLGIGFSLSLMYILFPGKPFQTSSKLTETQQKLATWTSNPEFFYALLHRQRRVNVEAFSHEIILGNTDANTGVVMVMDPACKPCEKALRELLKIYPLLARHTKLYLRFTFNTHDLASTHVIDQLLSLNLKGQEGIVLQALNDFVNLPYKKWIKRYNVSATDELAEQRKAHLEWYKRTGLNQTPVFLVDGYLLPEQYTINDLPFVVQEAEAIIQH